MGEALQADIFGSKDLNSIYGGRIIEHLVARRVDYVRCISLWIRRSIVLQCACMRESWSLRMR